MRIESATVENHRFGVARRRGYDSDEVDAVMSRVADTLAQYERTISRLEERVESSKLSRDDIKSVVEVQENRNRLLNEAKSAAAQIIDAATDEASAIRNEASLTADRIIGAAEDHLGAAQVDAQRLREEAASLLDLANERAEELRRQAESILTSAIAEAEKKREDSEAEALRAAAEAEKMLHIAQAEANRIANEAAQLSAQAKDSADAAVADVLAQARRQAEAMINSAVDETRLVRQRLHSELDEMRVDKEAKAEQHVASARNEAAEIRAAAAATAEAIAAQGRVDAEEHLANARRLALERLTTAQEEAEELLTQAGHESDAMLAAARENNRRLEKRTAQLQAAITEFEAHIANLAEVAGDRAGLIKEMISQRRPAQDVDPGAPPRAPRKRGKRSGKGAPQPDSTIVAQYAEPNGSGQLPAVRPTVPSYSDPWTDDPDLTIDIGDDSAGNHDTGEEQFVYDGEATLADATAESPMPDDGDDATTRTIYQRRGGGIKRRIEAVASRSDEPA